MQICPEKPKVSSNTLSGKILVIAGETSGDQHGADLIKSLNAQQPHLEFYAMGGKHIAETNTPLIVDSTDLAVVGFVEIIKIINKIRKTFNVLKSFIRHQKPDLVVLIDYPGFNLRMAKYAKKHGCKVLYYISPQLWAWRESRIKIIQKYVDQMAVIFPFEVDFYRKHGISANYVGNPLLHQLPLELTRESARDQLKLDQNKTIIGLLPGSRKAEIKRMLPIFIDSARKLYQKDPSIEFILPLASSLTESDILPYLPDNLPINVIRNNRFAALKAANSLIATSGTVTLEAALLGTPHVIAYKGSYISYFIAKNLVKIDKIGLSNIVAGKKIVQEFIQAEATAKNLAAETSVIIRDQSHSAHIEADLKKIRDVFSNSTNQVSLESLIKSLV